MHLILAILSFDWKRIRFFEWDIDVDEQFWHASVIPTVFQLAFLTEISEHGQLNDQWRDRLRNQSNHARLKCLIIPLILKQETSIRQSQNIW